MLMAGDVSHPMGSVDILTPFNGHMLRTRKMLSIPPKHTIRFPHIFRDERALSVGRGGVPHQANAAQGQSAAW